MEGEWKEKGLRTPENGLDFSWYVCMANMPFMNNLLPSKRPGFHVCSYYVTTLILIFFKDLELEPKTGTLVS